MDIGLGWLDLLLLGPFIAPWAALLGALAAGILAYRRGRSVYGAFAAAMAGIWLGPCAVWLLAFCAESRAKAAPSPGIVALLLGVAVLVGGTGVAYGIGRAAKRRR